MLLGVLALDGCVTYPSAVATKGQDTATAERDANECRKQAEQDVAPPLAVGLGTKLVWALGGAVLGTGIMLGALAHHNTSSGDPKWIAVAIGAGAGLGFVIGSIGGTFKGGEEASRAARDRERTFTRCMTERGYRLE
jgi:hypothetical protein